MRQNISNGYGILIAVLALFAIALIVKWTARLILGVLDYAFLFLVIGSAIWFFTTPPAKRRLLLDGIKMKLSKLFKP